MLSYQDKIKVSNILDEFLGGHSTLKIDEQVYYCPFCNHRKKKLNINLSNQKWHCWVCDAKGKSIYFLLKKLGGSSSILSFINKIYESEYYIKNTKDEKLKHLYLPKEFRSLTDTPKQFDPSFKKAIHYLKNRGITSDDIIKHNLGFCSHGDYAGRIIIPSYDGDGILNYFTARTIFDDESYKYKNPEVSRDIIPFSHQINWKEAIIIVEGPMDAISIKRNAIPILGKVIPKQLLSEIFLREVKKIYIMLDSDAQKQALYYTNYFIQQGIECTNIQPHEKDANQMGFEAVINLIKNTKNTNFGDLIFQKLNL